MKKKDYLKTGIFIILFIILGILVKCGITLGFDRAIFNAVISIKSDFTSKVLDIITKIGSTKICILMLFMVGAVMLLLKKLDWYKYVFLNTAFAAISMKVIKEIIQRPRPEWMWIEEDGYSFPSGHTICAIALYGTLILILVKKVKGKLKLPIIILCGLLMLLIPFSRIYFGVHYFTDILGSTLLAGSLIVLANVFLNKEAAHDKDKDK